MTKQKISFWAGSITWQLEDSTLKNAILLLQEMADKYGEDATIDICGDDVEISIASRREETDEEYAMRQALEALSVKRKESQELAEYRRLQAKFGEQK